MGGYQQQFELLLPVLRASLDLSAVAAVRQPPPPGSDLGWPVGRSVAVRAWSSWLRRKAADPWVVVRALLVGVTSRAYRRRPVTLLLLSPTMAGAAALARAWRRLGPVCVRHPGTGTLGRSRVSRSDVTHVVLSPEQVDEAFRHGVEAVRITNAVESADEGSSSRGEVLLVGRLIESKRPLLVLDAWRRVADLHRGWRMSVIGSGQGERGDVEIEVRRACEQLGDRAQFEGEVVDARARFGPDSVLVFASLVEGVPNVVLEALSSGCPVVADSAAMAKWFDPVPPHLPWDGRDASSLGEAIGRALADGDLRSQLSSEGRSFVASHHDVTSIGARWTELLSGGAS